MTEEKFYCDPEKCPNCGGTEISYLWYHMFFCHECGTEIDAGEDDE